MLIIAAGKPAVLQKTAESNTRGLKNTCRWMVESRSTHSLRLNMLRWWFGKNSNEESPDLDIYSHQRKEISEEINFVCPCAAAASISSLSKLSQRRARVRLYLLGYR